MEIKIAELRYSGLRGISVSDGNTIIDMGLMDKDERKKFAESLLKAVYDVCYNDMQTEEYRAWIEENT